MQHTANIGESDVCSYRTDHILPIDKTMNDKNYNLSITICMRDMVYIWYICVCMLHVPQIKFVSKHELSPFTFKEYNSKYFFVTITLDFLCKETLCSNISNELAMEFNNVRILTEDRVKPDLWRVDSHPHWGCIRPVCIHTYPDRDCSVYTTAAPQGRSTSPSEYRGLYGTLPLMSPCNDTEPEREGTTLKRSQICR